MERRDGESLEQYTKRMLELRELGEITYSEWSRLTSGYECSNENGRKSAYYMKEWLKKKDNDKISKPMLEEVRELIGELDIKKQEVRTKTQQMNKIKRDLIKSVEIANDIKDEMYANGFSITIPEYEEVLNIELGGSKAIVHVTDWHLGLIINNCQYNSFNLSIAKDRVNQLYNKVKQFCDLFEVKEIVVISTGDMIEHCYMRNNQHENVEFNQSVQINECINLMYIFLTNLCSIGKVDFYGIAGNHDRTVGDKNVNTKGDNANTIITEQLYNYNKLANNKRLTIHRLKHDAKDIIINVNGTICKFIHGDEKIKDGKRLIENDFSMDNCPYDVLFRGHWHNFNMESENNGRYIVTTGCLSGYNDYSTKFGCATQASQTLAIVSKNGIELIKDILLN